MSLNLEKKAGQLWENYSEGGIKFWKKYEKLIKASKASIQVLPPIPQTTPSPVVANWEEAYHQLPQQTFEFYQVKSIKLEGLQFKRNALAFLMASGLTALSSLLDDSEVVVYTFLASFLAFSGMLTTIKTREKCILKVNPDYIEYTFDQETKKIFLKKLVSIKLTKKALILKADYDSHGMRTYKFLLKDKNQNSMPEATKKMIVDFIEAGVQVNKAARRIKK
ncbi:hypothetical protein BKI52_45065 [marine bacterium AO1-C]|nr:hypothetical protein BKI52_45065 [marine bacterium AO1-C]